MDVLGQWFEARCNLGADKTIEAMKAYQSYAEWTRANGFTAVSSNAFGRRLKEQFLRKKTTAWQFYIGLGVNSSA
jgi:phage/plasmid-associated DNA primase